MAGSAESAPPPGAEAQADELLVLREIFGEDCHVQSEVPGRVAFSLCVAVDLQREGEDGRVRLAAEVPEGDPEEGHGGGATWQQQPPAPEASVLDLVEQRLRGQAPAPAAPRLERSRSGRNVAHAKPSVKHLPPITLQVSFPPGYPEAAAPDFHLACEWLTSEQLARLCAELDAQAEGVRGSPVVYEWAEFLRAETPSVLGITDTVVLSVSAVASDPRAVADCVDPMSSMMELLQYDQQKELELWRKQPHHCGICFSEKAGTQFVNLGNCLHAFCSECLGAMAKVHVSEGSIVELKCPLPACRAEMGAVTLEQVLDEPAYERWVRLKTQQILSSELDNVVWCPRCEEFGADSPTLAEAPASPEEAPVATCRRCGYLFCAKCLGVAHARIEECISEEDRMMQVALRRVDKEAQSLTWAQRRQQKRGQQGALCEIAVGEPVPCVDVLGIVTADLGPMKEGDEILSVSLGEKGDGQQPVWLRAEHDTAGLEAALALRPPMVIRFRAPHGGAMERMRKKRMLEELLTLRAIRQDSQPCPRCAVRISRSQGCNHMRCTKCDTHFCYRCGATMPAVNPYSHFQAGGCPTFDQQEVRRMVMQERQGDVDHELQELQRQFGRQEELFAHFDARRQQDGGRRGGGFRQRHQNDTPCPTCRQWNARQGRLNAARCHACRSSYCHQCGRRIEGVVTQHFRGEGACPQHAEAS